MDRAKTLEVLRGMKFMQRKEEAKRRELFEVQQKERLEGRLPHEGGEHGKSGEAGPTILYVHNYPTSAYALSRRSFKAARTEAGEAEASKDPSSSAAVIDGSAVHTSIPMDRNDDHEEEDEESFEMTEEMDPSAPGYQKSKDTAESADRPAKRFYVEGGIRAPKLPKRLEQEMGRRKRQRDAEDEEEDEIMPW